MSPCCNATAITEFSVVSDAGGFATAVAATYDAASDELTVCNAGHPRPFLFQAAKGEWSLLGADPEVEPATARNMPLGILDVTEYEQFDVELDPGDCVLSYTDALIESRDADGEMLGEAGLLRILRHIGDEDPQALTRTLLREIRDRYPDNLTEDDVTVLLVRANGRRKPRPSFKDFLWANLRFAGLLIRGINPWAERPPLPDMNVANIGGAIIPSLQQRWRANSSRSTHP